MASTPARRIRIGLVGAGNWALHGHVRALNLLPGYELVAVQSRRRGRPDRQRVPFVRRHPDHQGLCRSADFIDGRRRVVTTVSATTSQFDRADWQYTSELTAHVDLPLSDTAPAVAG